MKTARILLVASALLNVALLANLSRNGHRLRVGQVERAGPFETLVRSNANVVTFQNGRFCWTVYDDQLTMNVGLYKSATFNLDPSNDVVKSIVLEIQPTNGPGYYVSDVDGDGIPEQRMFKDTWDKELFYGGKFVRLYQDQGPPYVVLDGRTNRLRKVGGKLVPSE